VAILDDKVKAGDKLVTSGQLKVMSGVKVKIAPVDTLAEDYKVNKDNPRNE
jgi:hypothetical protein